MCSSVYAGHHSVMIPPSEVESNPSLWLSTVAQQKGFKNSFQKSFYVLF